MAYVDNGRGQFNYHTNWFWATFMAVMSDGTRFGVSLGDGSASEFNVDNRFSEDFINFKGQIYKLDQTILTFNPNNMTEEFKLETVTENKIFTQRNCSLTFQPVQTLTGGLHLGVIGFTSRYIYGYYNGKCHIHEEDSYSVKDLLGVVDLVNARW